MCRLKGLSPEDVLIYQHIATAGNLGAFQLPWTRLASWLLALCCIC